VRARITSVNSSKSMVPPPSASAVSNISRASSSLACVQGLGLVHF